MAGAYRCILSSDLPSLSIAPNLVMTGMLPVLLFLAGAGADIFYASAYRQLIFGILVYLRVIYVQAEI